MNPKHGAVLLLALATVMAGCVGNGGPDLENQAFEQAVAFGINHSDPTVCLNTTTYREYHCGNRGPLMGDCRTYIYDGPQTCIRQVVSRLNSPEGCAKIQLQAVRDYCYYWSFRDQDGGQGIREGSLCEKIENRTMRQDCQTRLAVAKNDEAACAKLEEPANGRTFDEWMDRDDCYTAIAKQEKRPEACIPIDNPAAESFCITFESGRAINPDYCQSIAPQRHEDCIAAMAIASYEPNECTQVKRPAAWTEEQKERCLTEYAQVVQDKTVCNGIENETARQKCLKPLPYQ